MFDLRADSADGLHRNRVRFERLLTVAQRYAGRSQYEMAAAWAEIAADRAWSAHPGFFADARLEQLLARIGEAMPPASWSPGGDGTAWPHRVLHVLTEAYAIGGHTRLVWRWIQADRMRQHCMVLTRQRRRRLPEALMPAPQTTDGWVRVLDWRRHGPVARARQLRAVAAEFDLVVLHVHPFDVVP